MTAKSCSGLNVSRETMNDLESFKNLLLKWTPKINLISKPSISYVWERHIWDSVQLYPFVQNGEHIVDFGSGGGLPALVLAILAKHDLQTPKITMIESDKRKSVFLKTVIRELALNADVLSSRIEAAPKQNAPVVTARALAELEILLGFANQHLAENGAAFFMKGENWEKEVADARESWSFSLKAHKSKTNPKAAILEVRNIERV
jgi:16S rRNA (guanine527-N7)-methyltransferase